MAERYAGAIIYRENEFDGMVELLVIDTKSLHPKYTHKPMQTKFIGGTEEGHAEEDRDMLGTLRRELTEETDLRLPEEYVPEVIWIKEIPGHTKNFFLIPSFVLLGELRLVEKTIDGDWMSPPYWVDFETACHRLYPTHQAPLLEAGKLLHENVPE